MQIQAPTKHDGEILFDVNSRCKASKAERKTQRAFICVAKEVFSSHFISFAFLLLRKPRYREKIPNPSGKIGWEDKLSFSLTWHLRCAGEDLKAPSRDETSVRGSA